jgi:hypothetical protein
LSESQNIATPQKVDQGLNLVSENHARQSSGVLFYGMQKKKGERERERERAR